MRKIKRVIEIELDSEDLDRAIEKADRLVGLLQEAGREVSSIPERDLQYLRETAIQSISNSMKKTVENMADSL